MPTAEIDDVKEIIDTSLDVSTISDALSYAQERNEAVNTPSNQSTTVTKNIERFLAAIHIREALEPALTDEELGDTAATYEARELQWLRSQLDQWDPSESLADSTRRDTDRHVTSTSQ